MKLHVLNSTVGLEAFADFYRFPEERKEPAPLLVWTGSAISRDSYEYRRTREPKAVLDELTFARGRLGDPPCDLLALSTPPTLSAFEGSAEIFRRFLAFELFPLLPAPHATCLGLVGNSFGGHLLMGLACRRPDVRAIATLAGVGLWSAIAETGGELPGDISICCFTNDQDFGGFFSYELVEELKVRGRELTLVERPGEQRFSDYAANGSVADAFEFVLQAVAQPDPTPTARMFPLEDNESLRKESS